MPEDVLDALLQAALRDRVLDAGSLASFAAGLRDRAALIVAERIRPVEERAAAFEKESAWRAELVQGLEREKQSFVAEKEALLHELEDASDAHRRAQGELEDVRAQHRAASEAHERVRAEAERLRSQWGQSAEAHDRLLAHHRDVLTRLAEALLSMPAALPWHYRRVQTNLETLVGELRKEIG